MQDYRQTHRQVHTTQAKSKDVFDYSEETITRLTRKIQPKSLSFDDQIRIHHHNIEQENDNKENRNDDVENFNQPGKDNE